MSGSVSLIKVKKFYEKIYVKVKISANCHMLIRILIVIA